MTTITLFNLSPLNCNPAVNAISWCVLSLSRLPKLVTQEIQEGNQLQIDKLVHLASASHFLINLFVDFESYNMTIIFLYINCYNIYHDYRIDLRQLAQYRLYIIATSSIDIDYIVQIYKFQYYEPSTDIYMDSEILNELW